MKKLFLFLVFAFVSIKINAQKMDRLARCGRASYLLVVNYGETDNGKADYTYEQGGSKFTFKDNGNANFNKRYSRFELNPGVNLDNDTQNFYKIILDTVTLYVDDIRLQDFIQDYLLSKKSNIHQSINLKKYFSSVSYQKYAIDRKNNVPNYDNGYCFNKLEVTDIKYIQTSLAIKNILLDIKNEGIVTNSINGQISVESKNGADFTADLDYYVVGKPSLRIRFKINNNNKIFEGIIKNLSENSKYEIKVGDIVTNVQQ
ncbi:MAG TPA: hypothetical protein VF677_00185 [Flavobacterium sp.]|jgi:hypothetical protein